jgi:4-diphosphocytidyl-2-C-methyl-D-erythritol kinase
LPDAWYVVLFPPVHVSTGQIFSHPDLTRNTISFRIRGLSEQQLHNAHNDLEPVVCRLYPDVARYLAWLGQFAQARMTGSGASVFAEFAAEAKAQTVLARLPPGMRGVVAHGLAHHPLRDFVSD